MTLALPPTLAVSVWCAGTLSHFLLTGAWVDRFGWGGRTADARFFTTMLVATATLSAALHLVAITTGLGVFSVTCVLAAGHLVTWRMTPARHPGHRQPAAPAETSAAVTSTLAFAAAVVLMAMVLRWVVMAAPNLEVSGTDAAHYHVPNAVNLALGASLFDLPPSSHLYPMGTSTLAAWFILPFGDPLLLDLTTIIPFLLLTAGLCRLFGLTTGLSGLAWMTWPTLALFGTRLFRSASLMSADLMFAASATALAAVLYGIVDDRRLTRSSLLLAALACGLLLGVKTTGLVALILFGGPGLVIFAVLVRRGVATVDIGPAGLSWIAAALWATAAGGIWLVRNWWMWGSPVVPNGLTLFGIEIFRGVPFERTTYLSVLGDLAREPAYPLAERTAYYVGEWLGPWYLVALLPIVFIPIDALACRIGRRPVAPIVRRLALLAVVAGTMAPMLWLLVGAPWTSLEWTRGMALRYAQPWWALLPLSAVVGLFPASLPWYTRRAPAAVAGVALALGAGVLLASGDLAYPPLPTVATGVVALLGWVWIRPAAGRRAWQSAAALIVVSIGFAVWTTRLDVEARAQALTSSAAAPRTSVQLLYDAARDAEARLGRSCNSRRFFVTTRLDEPLGLEDVAFTNLVFYAARDVTVTARVRPLGACDYVISTRDVLTTRKGTDLLAALNPFGSMVDIAAAGPFVLLGTR